MGEQWEPSRRHDLHDFDWEKRTQLDLIVGKDLGQMSCFAVETRWWTPMGENVIEQFQVGDLILSRSEFDPDGPVEAREVEEDLSARVVS